MTEEVELEFKRFSKEKQEQVRQLVAYTTLMGLSGKDLVSIGGKLDRIQQRKDREHRLSIVTNFHVELIGKDKDPSERFKLKSGAVWYHIERWGGRIQVTNKDSKKSVMYYLGYGDWGRTKCRHRMQYQFLWELYQGKITLP